MPAGASTDYAAEKIRMRHSASTGKQRRHRC
jgi:hypothetical protein